MSVAVHVYNYGKSLELVKFLQEQDVCVCLFVYLCSLVDCCMSVAVHVYNYEKSLELVKFLQKQDVYMSVSVCFYVFVHWTIAVCLLQCMYIWEKSGAGEVSTGAGLCGNQLPGQGRSHR